MCPRLVPDARVVAMRHFNRFYTRQIGLLDEGLLDSSYSLTQMRILYELANRERTTAVELCMELGLDAGYLSRILARFQKSGLIERRESHLDGRQTLVTLSKKGQRVFEPLNARSNAQVGAMLGRLAPEKQDALIQAMSTIESVLACDGQPVRSYLLRAHRAGDMGWVVWRHGVLYRQEYHYDERFEALVARIVAEFIENFDATRERCWIAEKDGANVGSVFVVKKSAAVAKLRLLLVEPSARGLGIGKRLVEECVRFAREAGYKRIMLWTQSELLAARGIYQAAGFKLVGEEKHSSWSRKDLVAETWELKL
jgi:DNA-binding MarR family transcriptional regulator/GNAT superfamily N-acetyltransferase